jgi:hypothetical protein
MSPPAELLQTRVEILKLAQVLGRAPESLHYLESVPLEDVRALRERITEALFTAHGHALERLAMASKLLPVGLVATISERAFGPLLSARMAAILEPARAIDVAAKLPPGFLADVAIEMDPRRASEVIGSIPPRQIGEVTAELVRRGEHVTMGRFVGHLGDEAIVAALAVMDDQSLLRITFVLEEKDRLEHLVDLMPEGRLAELVATAAAADLWLEAIDFVGHLSPRRRREFAQLAADLGVLAQLGSLGEALMPGETVA